MEVSDLLVWLFLLTAAGFAVILGLLWVYKTFARKDHMKIKTKAENEWK
jgi:hypothetical protein